VPLQIVRNDITHMKVDAIVNSACKSLGGGGGVDGAIHKAAGRELLKECLTLGGCEVGQAKITKGYKLPARYVIHTVGPVWHGGSSGEKELLESCYRSSLELARDYQLETVAFPLISAGIFSFPRELALNIAVTTISSFLMENDMMVYIVVFDPESYHLSGKLFHGIAQYIDENYVNEHTDLRRERFRDSMRQWLRGESKQKPSMSSVAPDASAGFFSEKKKDKSNSLSSFDWSADNNLEDAERFDAALKKPEKGAAFGGIGKHGDRAKKEIRVCATMPESFLAEPEKDDFPGFLADTSSISLEEALKHVDESFSQMVLRLIDQRGMKDPECYKRANMDRKLFSKIRNDIAYKPKKTTAVALAIALSLNRQETDELLLKAGFALSPSSKFDIIIEYCLKKQIYDIHQVNQILFDFDQPVLGV